jgi:actin beta/gamma 1
MAAQEEIKKDPLRPLILDVGTNTFRLGFAGDDFPVILAPSVHVDGDNFLFTSDVIEGLEDIFAGKGELQKFLFGEEALKYKHILKISEFRKEKNYNIFLKFFEYYYKQLEIAPEFRYKQPIIVIAPFLMTEMEKSKFQQIFFDELNLPHILFLSESQAIMATLQKNSGVVVNMGESQTYIDCFFHGFTKIMARDVFPIAGKELTNHMLNMSLIKKGSGKQLYLDSLIAKEIKEKTSLCVLNPIEERKRVNNGLTKYDKVINLPDGNSLKINMERFLLAEPLFNPALLHIDYINLAEAIAKVVKSWDRENWEELISTIILSGGGSLIPGLKERLKIELQKLFPPKINPKINVIAVKERDNMSWIGASILYLRQQLVKGWIENENKPNEVIQEDNQNTNQENLENN